MMDLTASDETEEYRGRRRLAAREPRDSRDRQPPAFGYGGRIFPINSKYAEIEASPAIPTREDVTLESGGT